MKASNGKGSKKAVDVEKKETRVKINTEQKICRKNGSSFIERYKVLCLASYSRNTGLLIPRNTCALCTDLICISGYYRLDKVCLDYAIIEMQRDDQRIQSDEAK
ncbi:hypothetical protein Tco_1506222 [Tanacetum coccineum]